MTSRRPGRRRRTVLVAVVLAVLVGTSVVSCDAGRRSDPADGRAATTRSTDRDPARSEGARLGDPRRTGARCRGVVIGTDEDPHEVMRKRRAGTTFCLGPGVHRVVRPLLPQEGDTIAGRPGAVVSGARVLTGWQEADQGWTAAAHLPDEPSDQGECLPERPGCTFAEDVFIDGQPLVRVTSRDALTTETFFADYSRNTITVGTDPGGRLVEQAVAPALVRSAASGVTVRDLVLQMAANEAQEAAVDGRTSSPRTGRRWRVVGNLVRLNHGVGIGIGSRGTVRGNEVRAQGQLGVSVWERGAVVRHNVMADNGLAGYDPDWEAGGLKAWVTEDVRLVDNQVHDNRGPGLWSDGGCLRTTYRRNVVTHNWGAGIQHEISHDAVIVRNRVADNGLRHKGWGWEAGISIQSSGGTGLIVVERNRVSGGAHGIMVLESGQRRREWPTPHGPHVVRDVVVRRNTVTLREGQWVGVVQDVDDHAVFRRGIRFRNNTYRLESPGQRAFAWKDDLLSWPEWHTSAGQDVRGNTTVLP